MRPMFGDERLRLGQIKHLTGAMTNSFSVEYTPHIEQAGG